MQTLWPLLGRFGRVEERESLSLEIARAVGSDRLLLFVWDEDVQRYLPGPGYPRTLTRHWATLVATAAREGTAFGELPLEGKSWPARADLAGEAVLVLLGGQPQPDTLLGLVPLMGALLKNEVQARRARELAEQADRSASEAENLARSLDQTRREVQLRLRELSEAKAQAEAANQSKSNFLANMSHEIRTPMAAIFGYVDILRRQATDPDDTECLNIIQRNGEHLLEIVNDILDLSKIEAGKLQVEATEVHLSPLISDVLSLTRLRADEKNLDLQVSFEYPLPEVIISDAVRLRQILLNLLGNAVKFTAHGFVRLSVRHLPEVNKLELAVEDSGPGIEPDILPELFRPFQQADSSITRRFGGTGLGLTISLQLALLLGGTIEASSQLGVGSRFVVQVSSGNLTNVRWLASDAQLAVPARSRAAVPSLHGLTALVVDDRRDMRDLVRSYLEEAGATVHVVPDGCAGLEVLGAHRIDTVVLDMQMPLMDGYETAREIRARGYQVPILALTANAMKGDRDRCLEAGCNAYLSKPIDRSSLLFEVKAQASRLRILVVEDNRLAAFGLKRILESLGCEVALAESGNQALSRCCEHCPQIALLDLGLPDMDGWTLLAELRQRCPEARLIAHTGRSSEELVSSDQTIKFDDYLAKPASRDDLLRSLFVSIAGGNAPSCVNG